MEGSRHGLVGLYVGNSVGAHPLVHAIAPGFAALLSLTFALLAGSMGDAVGTLGVTQ